MNSQPAIYSRVSAVWSLELVGSTGPAATLETKVEEMGKAKMWSEAKHGRIEMGTRGLQDLRRPNPS